MSIEPRTAADAVRSRWRSLERDWQSVAVAATIVGLTVIGSVHIPW